MEEFDWFVGIDWGSQTHRACLMDTTGKVVGERDIAHSGAGLGEFFDWVLARTGAAAERIAVAIEAPHGPVVEGALERGFAVYSINPKQLDSFRDRFSIAGAKDDARDAMVAADSLRTDRRAFRRLAADEAVVIELREWSRIAEDLQHERNRLTNRMREQLWRYYPQALEPTDDLGAEWFLALWELMPRPDRVKKSRKPAIARILARHRIRRIDADELLKILRQRPLSVSPGAVAR